uniref:Uncharacterized protein n=1 Tax=Macrostomum lignano TaxID=282301 RepID=A0A1I8FIK4_9PLAT
MQPQGFQRLHTAAMHSGGIVADPRAYWKSTPQAWHPSAATNLSAGSAPNGGCSFRADGCSFAAFRNDDHVKAAAVDGFGEDFAQQQQNLACVMQQSPRLQAAQAAATGVFATARSPPCSSYRLSTSAPSPTSAACRFHLHLRRFSQQDLDSRSRSSKQQHSFVTIWLHVGAGVLQHGDCRSASVISDTRRSPQLPLLLALQSGDSDDSEPTAYGEED